MLVIDYTSNGTIGSKEFPETLEGTEQSIKFIEQLYKERKNHPWYYKQKQIELLQLKLSNARKKSEMKFKLYQLEKERREHLEICEVSSPPPLMKLNIYKR